MDAVLHVERICYPVTNLGPGRRVAIWLQGCSRRCPGCMSPELFVRRPESARPVADVARALCAFGECDGVTVSGGEPFEQAAALAVLLESVKRAAGLEVMVYTGFRRDELVARGEPCAAALAHTDILVDGPFLEEQPNTLLWRGSDNQGMHLLTPRAQQHEPLRRATYGARRRLHFQCSSIGDLVIVGIPERGFARQFASMAARHCLTTNDVEEA